MKTSVETCESPLTCVEDGPDLAPALPAPPAEQSRAARVPLHSFTIYLAVAVPILLCAAIVLQGLDWSWVRSKVREKSYLESGEDFRHDLGGWASQTGAPTDWAFNASGSVAPAQLAIFIKSLPASDYRMQFRATLGRQSVGFVYRALDFRNYYAGRIVFAATQSIPAAVLERYSVVDGVESAHTRVKLPFAVRAETLYDVKVEARADHFVTRINDKFVDGFTDNQFKSGGVGLFGGPEKAARISWLRFTANDNPAGKVFLLLNSVL